MSIAVASAVVKAMVPHLVHCAHCDCKFIYEMKLLGAGGAEIGFGNTRSRARDIAEGTARAQLAAQLDDPDLCDFVSCPKCFRYQPYMCKRLAEQKFAGLGYVFGYPVMGIGMLVAVLAIVVRIASFEYRDTAQLAVLVGIGGMIFGSVVLVALRWLASRYNPNATRLAERERIAEARALSLEEFHEVQLKRARKAYEEFTPSGQRAGLSAGNPFNAREQALVIVWWVEPSFFMEGGTITIALSKTKSATVVVPENARPGALFDLRLFTPNVTPFKVRVQPIRVHPDEQRLE